MKKTILFADNDDGIREKWGEFLIGAGYTVLLGGSQQE